VRRAWLTPAILLGACTQPSGWVTLPPEGLPNPYRPQEVRTGTVTGRVHDAETKSPIPDVAVEVLDVEPPIQTKTDAAGEYRLARTPQGKQIVAFRKDGYLVTPLFPLREPAIRADAGLIADVLPDEVTALPAMFMRVVVASPTLSQVVP
jgi:hypothetical protein